MTLTLEKISVLLLAGVLLGLAAPSPIAQDLAYHAFADRRALGAIPNAADVLSNLAFLLVGVWGLRVAGNAPVTLQGSIHLFSVGLVLTALGSAYYHWSPENDTLMWDRLPMVIAFAGVIGALAHEHLGEQATHRWQNAWLYLGFVSVALCAIADDFRLYVVVQFGGLLLGALWMAYTSWTRKKHSDDRRTRFSLPWHWAWIGYIFAKLAESADSWVWELTGELISGHPLKHVFAALGVVPVLLTLHRATASTR